MGRISHQIKLFGLHLFLFKIPNNKNKCESKSKGSRGESNDKNEGRRGESNNEWRVYI